MELGLFTEQPQFITDDKGNRVKVILTIDDFYALLAKAEQKNEVKQKQEPVLERTTSNLEIKLDEGEERSADAVFKRAFELIKRNK